MKFREKFTVLLFVAYLKCIFCRSIAIPLDLISSRQNLKVRSQAGSIDAAIVALRPWLWVKVWSYFKGLFFLTVRPLTCPETNDFCMFTDCEIQAKEIFASPIILVYSAAQYWLHAILKWVRSGRRVIEGLTFLMHRRFCNDVLPKSTLEDPGDLIQASQTSHQLYQAHIWWNHPRSCKIIQDHPRLQGILGDITRKMLVLRFQLPPLPPQFQLGCLGAVGDMTRNGVGSLHKTVPKDMQQRTLVCGDLLKKTARRDPGSKHEPPAFVLWWAFMKFYSLYSI